MNRFVVQKNSVMTLAVLSEGFAVIRHHGNYRVFIQAASLESRDQRTHRCIRISNFSIVGICGKAGLVWLRRLVRAVRVIAVHPHENRAGWMPAEPGKRMVNDFPGAPFNTVIAVFARAAPMVTGIVSIKASIKADGSHI